jgi:hypothetical protein
MRKRKPLFDQMQQLFRFMIDFYSIKNFFEPKIKLVSQKRKLVEASIFFVKPKKTIGQSKNQTFPRLHT